MADRTTESAQLGMPTPQTTRPVMYGRAPFSPVSIPGLYDWWDFTQLTGANGAVAPSVIYGGHSGISPHPLVLLNNPMTIIRPRKNGLPCVRKTPGVPSVYWSSFSVIAPATYFWVGATRQLLDATTFFEGGIEFTLHSIIQTVNAYQLFVDNSATGFFPVADEYFFVIAAVRGPDYPGEGTWVSINGGPRVVTNGPNEPNYGGYTFGGDPGRANIIGETDHAEGGVYDHHLTWNEEKELAFYLANKHNIALDQRRVW